MIPLAALPAIASVAGSAMDAWSQRGANASNERNVQAQIAFQREQSGTVYQRGVADMKAAGLNPALAYTQGGAPAAQGASATVQPITQNSASKFATAAETYNAIANGVESRNLLRSQANASDAQAELTRYQAGAARPLGIYGRSDENVAAENQARFREAMARGFVAEKTPERWRADMSNLGAGTALAQQQTERARTETTLNEQNFMTAWYRKNMAPYVNSASHSVRAAGGLSDLIQPWRPKAKPALKDGKSYDEEVTYDRDSDMKFTRRTYKKQ